MGRWVTVISSKGRRLDEMKLIPTLLLAVLSSSVFSLDQRPDTVRMDDTLYLMYVSLFYNNPVLEYYLVNKQQNPFGVAYSTNCYRAHVACYSIQNDSIFVDSVSDLGSKLNEKSSQQTERSMTAYKWYNLDTLFSVDKINQKVFAEWFTGYLRLQTLKYESKRKYSCDTTSMVTYGSDEYIILKVTNGRIMEKEVYDNFTFWALQWKCDANVPPEHKRLYQNYEMWISEKSGKRKYWKKD